MKQIPTKADGVGDTLSADEFNPNQDELENAVTKTGQTLSAGNTNQLGQAISKYASGGGGFYVDTGSANTYVLGGIGNFLHSTVLFDGFKVSWLVNVTNTGPSTINPNGIGVTGLVSSLGAALTGNELIAGAPVSARYNLANDEFRLLDTARLNAVQDTNGFSINGSKGANVASATQPNIWAGDGDTLHITGTTTITDFTDAPRIGAWKKIIFDGILTFTHGSGITLPGGANITTAAGDIAFIYADAVDAFRVVYHRVDGQSIVGAIASQSEQEAGTSIVAAVTPGRQQFHPSAVKGYVKFSLADDVIDNSYNVSSVADVGAGIGTINWDVNFSSADYAVCMGHRQGGDLNQSVAITSAGACTATLKNDAGTGNDTVISVIAFGDQ